MELNNITASALRKEVDKNGVEATRNRLKESGQYDGLREQYKEKAQEKAKEKAKEELPPITTKTLIQDEIDNTAEVTKDAETLTKERAEEDKKQAEEREAQAIANQKEREAIAKAKSDSIKEIADFKEKEIVDRAKREADILEEEKNMSIDEARAEAEELRIKNEADIRQAEIDIETNKVNSAYAFNKLGLGFSGGIILQAQQIANNGSVKIAELKSTLRTNQVKINNDIKKIEIEYTREVNSLIDTAVDAQVTIKENEAARIDEINNNLLLSEEQKQAEVNAIKDGYKTSTRQREDDMKVELENITNKQIENVAKLEAIVENEKVTAKTELNESLNTGSWFNKTSAEKINMLKAAGYTAKDMVSVEQAVKNDKINGLVAEFMPKGFFLPVEDRTAIRNDINKFIQGGMTLDEASRQAVEANLENNEEYKQAKAIKELSAKVDIKALKDKLAPVLSGSGGKPEKGKLININDTWYLVDERYGVAEEVIDTDGNILYEKIEGNSDSFSALKHLDGVKGDEVSNNETPEEKERRQKVNYEKIMKNTLNYSPPGIIYNVNKKALELSNLKNGLVRESEQINEIENPTQGPGSINQ